jgi:hypothetical protein
LARFPLAAPLPALSTGLDEGSTRENSAILAPASRLAPQMAAKVSWQDVRGRPESGAKGEWSRGVSEWTGK